MLKRKAEVFAPTDGVLRMVGPVDDSPCGVDSTPIGADYSDPDNWMSDMYTLAFRRIRISSRDVELSTATGCELTAKVEVRAAPGISPDMDAVLGDVPHEVTRVEMRGSTCWLWLSEVACDGTCQLVSEVMTYDDLAIPHETETKTTVHVRRASGGLARVTAAGVDALDATCVLRLRAVDYDGQRTLVRGGVTYTVAGTETHGRWVDLTCRERGADRG